MSFRAAWERPKVIPRLPVAVWRRTRKISKVTLLTLNVSLLIAENLRWLAIIGQDGAQLSVTRLGTHDQRPQQARHEPKCSYCLFVRLVEPIELVLSARQASRILEVSGVEGPPRAPSKYQVKPTCPGGRVDGTPMALSRHSPNSASKAIASGMQK
jgi:hypothetical protein